MTSDRGKGWGRTSAKFKPLAIEALGIGAIVSVPFLAAWLLGWIDLRAALCALLASIIAASLVSWRWRQGSRALSTWLTSVAQQGDSASQLVDDIPMAAAEIRPLRAIARRSHRLTEHIRAYRDLIERFANSLPDPILFINSDLEIERCNEAAKRAFDLDSLPVPLVRALRDRELITAVQAARNGRQGVQLEFVPPQMPELRYAASLEPMSFADEAPGVLISIREKSEALLIEHVRSDFIANVSHEMRTPLTAMTGIVETLQTTAKNDPSAIDMFLSIMADETKRMRRLVDDLLTLARIESESSEAVEEECRLDDLFEQSLSLLERTVSSSNNELIVDLPEQPVTFIGDRDQLGQVMRNLIENAVKYGGRGKRIWVTGQCLEAAPPNAGALQGRPVVRIAVRDEGAGIAPQHLSRLSERFYRVDKARSRAEGGTGLGLAIVKHIVKRHKGQLSIESEIGKGSEFSVFLPI